MRDIKFRAWDIENKEMFEVQELDFEPTFWGGRIAIRLTQYSDYFDTEDMILMQYTGLKDKNGKEIYEGDIVEDKDIIGQVIFSVGSFDVKVLKVKTNVGTCEGVQYPLSDYYDECCVIGNIAEGSKYGFEI